MNQLHHQDLSHVKTYEYMRFQKITALSLLCLLTLPSAKLLQAQQLDATFSVVGGSRLQMVLNQPATFQFSQAYANSQNAFSVIIKNLYNSAPLPGGLSTASGLTYTTSGGKSGAATLMGTYSSTFGPFIVTTDEVVVFSLTPSTTISSGETLTIPAGTVIQALPGNYGAGQTFNAGPYTAVIANSLFNGIAATMTSVASTPSVTTTSPSAITPSTAVLGGNVTSNGGANVTERGIVWSTTANPTTANNKVTIGSGNGAFSATVNAFPAATNIHYRAYAINSQGTSYGSNTSFTTLLSVAVVAATVFLEGAYTGSGMNTSINASIPPQQPYNGENGHNQTTNVMSVPSDAVDWVLVELREASSAATANNATKVGSAAGFLMSDGSIKATNGTSDITISLSGNSGAAFYVVVYHRNHLPIMSTNALAESGGAYTIDFSTSQTQAFGTTPMVEISTGVFAMIAGDQNSDGQVDGTDLTNWRTQNGGAFGYASSTADFNLDGAINAVDRNDFQQPNSGKSSQVPN